MQKESPVQPTEELDGFKRNVCNIPGVSTVAKLEEIMQVMLAQQQQMTALVASLATEQTAAPKTAAPKTAAPKTAAPITGNTVAGIVEQTGKYGVMLEDGIWYTVGKSNREKTGPIFEGISKGTAVHIALNGKHAASVTIASDAPKTAAPKTAAPKTAAPKTAAPVAPVDGACPLCERKHNHDTGTAAHCEMYQWGRARGMTSASLLDIWRAASGTAPAPVAPKTAAPKTAAPAPVAPKTAAPKRKAPTQCSAAGCHTFVKAGAAACQKHAAPVAGKGTAAHVVRASETFNRTADVAPVAPTMIPRMLPTKGRAVVTIVQFPADEKTGRVVKLHSLDCVNANGSGRWVDVDAATWPKILKCEIGDLVGVKLGDNGKGKALVIGVSKTPPTDATKAKAAKAPKARKGTAADQSAMAPCSGRATHKETCRLNGFPCLK